MITLLVVLILVMVIGFGLVIYFLNRKTSAPVDDTGLQMLKTDLQGLNALMGQTHAQVSERLDRNNESMQASLQKQIGQSAQLIADVTERLTKLDETARCFG